MADQIRTDGARARSHHRGDRGLRRVTGEGDRVGADTVDRAHRPVLLHEAVRWLGCAPGKRIADVTVGLGGHAEAIMAACAPDRARVGLERADEALAAARARLAPARARLHRADARDLPEVLAREHLPNVDGVLFDLGVSSLQIDTPERGFSFQVDGPLDMRMDRRQETTAARLLNECSEDELTEMFRVYGEERWAARIAEAGGRAPAARPPPPPPPLFFV